MTLHLKVWGGDGNNRVRDLIHCEKFGGVSHAPIDPNKEKNVLAGTLG